MSRVGESLRASAVLNLTDAVTMVIDDNQFSLDLTIQVLKGFGARTRYACKDPLEAMQILQDHSVDLLVVDSEMPTMDGYDLVSWLRRSKLEPNAFVPVIMTAGHVRRSRVLKARDCGANFMVAKPFSPLTLLERITWAARDGRPFLEVGDYFGPDRRFREDGPPERGERRRDADLTENAEPGGPAMARDEGAA